MKKQYIFFEGALPPGYRHTFRGSIFNHSAYRECQSQTGWRSFYILSPDDKGAHGSMHFFVSDAIASSPLRAPFGSLEISAHIPHIIVHRFLDHVDKTLRQSGVTRIIIRNPPDLYEPETMALLSNFLLTSGYAVMQHDLGAIVRVSETAFSDVIHPRKKRKLYQSRDRGLHFVEVKRNALPGLYDFIADCRSQKNFRLSISLEELEMFVDRFPENYLFFAVYLDSRLVAASVVIRSSDHVLYHFISDHIRKIGVLRPSLVLMEGIYCYCQREKIRLLDLGTSTVDGRSNFKLVKFKTELGGQLTHKFAFSKTFT